MSEGGGKVIYRLVEEGAKNDLGNEGREVFKGTVEPRVQGYMRDVDGKGW